MTASVSRMRLALDQNFPIPLIDAVYDFLPADMQIAHLKVIDRRLSDLDDRSLVIALHQSGWDGLITNNYKMLDVPEEVAAIVKTKLTVIAIEGLGHDPLRAVGALLLARATRNSEPDQTQARQCFSPVLPTAPTEGCLGVLQGGRRPARPRPSRSLEPSRRHRARADHASPRLTTTYLPENPTDTSTRSDNGIGEQPPRARDDHYRHTGASFRPDPQRRHHRSSVSVAVVGPDDVGLVADSGGSGVNGSRPPEGTLVATIGREW